MQEVRGLSEATQKDCCPNAERRAPRSQRHKKLKGGSLGRAFKSLQITTLFVKYDTFLLHECNVQMTKANRHFYIYLADAPARPEETKHSLHFLLALCNPLSGFIVVADVDAARVEEE